MPTTTRPWRTSTARSAPGWSGTGHGPRLAGEQHRRRVRPSPAHRHRRLRRRYPPRGRQATPMILVSQVSALTRKRQVLATLVKRDLRVRYARSVLGYLWTVIDPLAMAGVYF